MLLVSGNMNLLLFAPDDAARIGAVADAMGGAHEGNGRTVDERHRLMELVEALGDPILVA